MRINELFTNKKDWDWAFVGSEEAVADFTVGDVPYRFTAYSHPENLSTWEVEFRVSRRDKKTSYFGITGTGNATEVFSVVVSIMRELLARKPDIDTLIFTANEPSRRSLYQRMIKRLMPNWDLNVQDELFTLTLKNK